jgi:hypothetical protein
VVVQLRGAVGTGDTFTRTLRFMLGMLLGAAVLSGISSARGARPPPPTPIIYSDFLRSVKQGRVRAVRFEVRARERGRERERERGACTRGSW